MHTRRSRYLRHRFPADIISHAVWLYHRYGLSFRDVEDLLAERAGSANINYFNVLPRPIVRFATGSFGYRRFLGAASPRVASGNLLAAFEYAQDDGPWERPNGLDKANGVLRYSQGDTRNGLSVTFMGYQNRWNSTDQIPQRAVESGLIGRFGFIEGTDGGDTSRYSGAVDWQRSGITTSTRVIGYLQRYSVQLFHNFTYFLNDPINGDQFEQFEEMWTSGAKVTHRRMGRVVGNPSANAVGIDFRNDSVGGPLGLYLTGRGERLSTARADEADQYSIGVFGQTEIEWSRVVRTVFGLRGDLYHWDVTARRPGNSGTKTDGILSPKVSAVFGPWRGTELYADWGPGFHSNSALGIMLSEEPLTGMTVEASPPFARAHGTEFGIRTVALPSLQTTATFWYLDFDSELIYEGDSGSTEDGPGSRRLGLEITNYFYPTRWTTVDLDVSFSRARFVDLPDGENFVPGALNRVIAGGVAVAPLRVSRPGHSAAFDSAISDRGRWWKTIVSSRSRHQSSTRRSGTSSLISSGLSWKDLTSSIPKCPTSTTSLNRGCKTSLGR